MLAGLSTWLTACSGAAQTDLDKVHASIEARYKNVTHIDGPAFSKLDKDKIVIFDVRKPEEYAVSHLDGAIRVDPGLNAETFVSEFGPDLKGRDIVFYCSVGERSSRLASQVKDKVSSGVYNLENGIFGWHNTGQRLVRQGNETEDIHPYDEKWGRLILRQEKVKYSPK